MNRIEVATVNQKIEDGFNFDFGKYISQGFEIFKKEWVLFSLYGLVSMILMMLSFMTIIGGLFFIYPLFLGYSVAAEKVERGEALEFKDFFGAFKNYNRHFLFTLCIFVVFMVLYLPFIFLFITSGMYSDFENSPTMGLSMGIFMSFYYIFFYVALFFVQGSMIFVPYLIHYGGFSTVDAIKSSFKLFKKQWIMILVFVFVTGILSSIGYFACLIGIFASMAAGTLMQYAMVKDILMQSSYSEIDQIGNTEF